MLLRKPATATGSALAQSGRAAALINGSGGGLTVDITLYGLSALFAGVTAAASTLASHQAWGSIAVLGYSLATLIAIVQWGLRRTTTISAARAAVTAVVGPLGRATVALGTWVSVAVLPLCLQAIERASGRTDRAQEEVLVIEDGGRRLLDTASPYLSRSEIAALPESERLLGYLPYQPAMAAFGAPRALTQDEIWWSDARLWFLLVTAVTLAAALHVLRHHAAPTLVRALQVATVFPVCALTLATGGDDLPVLALCLLALAFAATGRFGVAGVAAGAAAALKLFAWPVVIVIGVFALHRSRAARFSAGALGIPVLTALPVLIADPRALLENVVIFPIGHGLVASPAASPLPGHLIATSLPAGRYIALALLLVTAMSIAWWLIRRPPPTAAAAAVSCGLGLLAAILLLPTTRFGYLLYPIAFLVWALALSAQQPSAQRADAS